MARPWYRYGDRAESVPAEALLPPTRRDPRLTVTPPRPGMRHDLSCPQLYATDDTTPMPACTCKEG